MTAYRGRHRPRRWTPSSRGLGAAAATVLTVAGAAVVSTVGPSTDARADSTPVAPSAALAVPALATSAPGEGDRAALRTADRLAAADRAARARAAVRLAQRRAAARAQAARARERRALQADPRPAARALAAGRGWGGRQYACLDDLWISESAWRWDAENPSSGAYGIPQSLPARKMAETGTDWRTNPVTQIRWGLDYIAGRYGTPCSAWSFKRANNWY